jgi:hypothetical protein
VFASRRLHIRMLRNDHTVPTRCRPRSEIVDPHATRPVGSSARRSAIKSNTRSLDPKSSKTSQFSVIRRFIGIGSHASESCYLSYTVATSGVNRLANQIYHNRLFRKKLRHNFLLMISTEILSLASHNSGERIGRQETTRSRQTFEGGTGRPGG